MKHTIGYTTTAEFPVAISYKCLYCGADNTRTVYLQSKEFDFSKAGSSSAARIALQEKLDSLIEASSVEELKNAGLHCVCKKCGKAPPWTDNRLSAGTSIRIGFFAILAIIIALVAFFSGNSAIGEWSSSIIESGLLPIVIPVAVIVIIGIKQERGVCLSLSMFKASFTRHQQGLQRKGRLSWQQVSGKILYKKPDGLPSS